MASARSLPHAWRAAGRCEDSFGWHCALNADVPEEVIDRARYVSSRRTAGMQIDRIDFDREQAELDEKRRVALVDAFLAYDFGAGSATTFFEQQSPVAAATRTRRWRCTQRSF